MRKRWFLLGVILLLVLWLMVGCGVSQEQYDAVVAERDSAQAELQSVSSELKTIKSELQTAKLELEVVKSLLSEGKATPAPAPAEQPASVSTPTQKLTAIEVTAQELYSTYQANQVVADAKYKDKIVTVTGIVDTIGKDMLDTLYVLLTSGGQYEMLGVQCMFDNKYESELAQLTKGQTVAVQGRVTGYLANVLVEDCILVSLLPTPTPKPGTATDLSEFVSVNIVWDSGSRQTYVVITNSSESLVTVSFDCKLYDKDKSYLWGGKWNLHKDIWTYANSFVLPHSTLWVKWGNLPWDSFAISNLHAEELNNPFTTWGGKTVEVYQNIVFEEGPTLGNYKTLDPKWQIRGDDYYIVGEIKNIGQKTARYIRFNTILKNNGEVVGVFQGGNQMSLVPPPGEKVKFKVKLGNPPGGQYFPRMPDLYDSYEVTIISYNSSSR